MKEKKEDGGWSQFEAWAGQEWFGGDNPYKERYGSSNTVNTTNISNTPSKFPKPSGKRSN
jgi:hypothetical protein